MGSPFGPLLANIFIAELKTSLISNLNDKVKLWKRFVDDTYCLEDRNAQIYIITT